MKIYAKLQKSQLKIKYGVLFITIMLILTLLKSPIKAYDHQTAPPQANTFYGTVQLQGRSDHKDTRVFVTQGSCPSTYQTYKDTHRTLLTQYTALTNEDGYFVISPYSDDSDARFQCLKAVHDGFLVAEIRDPHIGDCGTVTLAAGEVTFDNRINIFDLTYIASRYGTNDPLADLDANERIDIFDLSMVAGNYGQKGPILDWR